MINDTLFIKGKSFMEGKLNNVIITDEYEIVLEKGFNEGYYESELIETIKFKELVASWNCKTNTNSSVELMVKINTPNGWSNWFSYGLWSTDGNNRAGESETQDEVAELDIDIIRPKTEGGKDLKFRINLKRISTEVMSPRVRLVTFTMAAYEKDFFTESIEISNIDLDVPERSQLVVPDIGGVICSPTSVSMILEYLGTNESTEKVATGCKDNYNKKYGNWSYNVAYAGEKDYEAYVKRCSTIRDVVNLINSGIPVAASIKTKDVKELDGTLQPHTNGHLIVIRGLIKKENIDYIIVNDPASKTLDVVKRHYKLDQFINVWSKIIYVIK